MMHSSLVQRSHVGQVTSLSLFFINFVGFAIVVAITDNRIKCKFSLQVTLVHLLKHILQGIQHMHDNQ